MRRFIKTRTMFTAIRNEAAAAGVTTDQYVAYLALWNDWFRTKQLRLHIEPISAANAIAILREIFDADRCSNAGFKLYCSSAKVRNPHRAIFDMRNQLIEAGLPAAQVYNAMHFVQQHSLNPGHLNAVAVIDFYNLSLQVPPRTAFAGFADWGPGNHRTISLNKRNHFLKHVLDAYPGPDQNLPWQGECAVWWEYLNIQLTRQDARDAMTHRFFHNHVVPLFPPTGGRDDVLPFLNVSALVNAVKTNGGWYPALLNKFVATYEDAYVQAAINLSQNMTNVIVHTASANSPVLMVKGINGRFFIGGRMEGNVLGISTCLVPMPGVDLVNLHIPLKVWQVSP